MTFTRLFSREYSVQYADCCMRMASNETKRHTPMIIHSCAYIPENKNEVFCIEQTEWKQFQSRAHQKWGTPRALHAFFRNFHRFGEKYVATAKQTGKLRVQSMTPAALERAYRNYFRIFVLYTLYLWLGLIINDYWAQKGQKILAQKKVTASELVSALFFPSHKSGILRLQDELSKLKKTNPKGLPSNTIPRLLKQYAWMPCLDLHNDPWTPNDLKSFFEHFSVPKKSRLSFKKAVQKAGLSKSEQKLFEQIRELAFVKDQRDAYRRKGVYAVLPFFDGLGSRLKTNRKNLAFVTFDELILAIRGQPLPSQTEIQKRQSGFVCRIEKNQTVIKIQPAVIRSFQAQLAEHAQESELHGICAFSGKASGIVRIVRGVSDLSKVKKGEILVAVTTHPDFVPAMHRAAAFVTDEGGITSHAAIVSREMKKPCIVGTRVATQRLKDGDRIEVDATAGLVRKPGA